MIGTLPEDLKVHWQQHVSTLVHTYYCTKSNATGYSPYYLMYGRHPLLPINIEFGVFIPDIHKTMTHKYVQTLRNHLEYAYKKARLIDSKESKRNKQQYDMKVRCSKLDIGDLVLVRKEPFTGKHKIADHWENDIYEVMSLRNDGIPVLTVKNLNGGKEWKLHHNMLFPLNQNIQSDNLQPIDVDESEKSTNTKEVEEIVDVDIGNQPKIEGPMTCSKTKQLMKANILMSEMFDQDFTFVPQNDQIDAFTPGFITKILNFFTNLVNH